jgi:hypothetical protein
MDAGVLWVCRWDQFSVLLPEACDQASTRGNRILGPLLAPAAYGLPTHILLLRHYILLHTTSHTHTAHFLQCSSYRPSYFPRYLYPLPSPSDADCIHSHPFRCPFSPVCGTLRLANTCGLPSAWPCALPPCLIVPIRHHLPPSSAFHFSSPMIFPFLSTSFIP